MDKKVGIIKEIDSLGRIVIPKELRQRFNLVGEVEVLATEYGVLLRNSQYELIKKNK